MGKIMYLKKESGYSFAPAIVKIINRRKYGSSFKVIYTFSYLKDSKYDYITKLWDDLNINLRQPTILELLRVPFKYYLKRR